MNLNIELQRILWVKNRKIKISFLKQLKLVNIEAKDIIDILDSQCCDNIYQTGDEILILKMKDNQDMNLISSKPEKK